VRATGDPDSQGDESTVLSFVRGSPDRRSTVPWAAPGSGDGPAPGERLGRYLVLRTLGTGGMGVVVAAHDPELDRRVAIKLAPTRTSSSSPWSWWRE
jgi:serine/threonine protein kinase